MTGKSFSVWLNNEYIPNNPDKVWMKEDVYKRQMIVEDDEVIANAIRKHLVSWGMEADRKSVV